ncbi:hypothetical protein EDC04DRAFT_2601286 [Pisolithus marmoratus]|nr:hypothetical protein EDC04DRAFT_2601286 [Pisolithus marmoratus]
MGSTVGPSGGGKEPPQYYFLSQSGSQISAKSKMKYTKKRTQESTEASGNEAVLWEPYLQLTRDLLTWILQHPTDCAVLFNEMVDENILGKPHSQQKKDINTYGESYTAHPAKFVTAVASHLVILKNKFKSTGEGISPNDPNHQNLHHMCSLSLSSYLCSLLAFNLEKVLVEFPFWDECDQLWCGNPAYDVRVFNATPGTNWTSDFLSIIKHGGTTSVPASGSSQVQGRDDVTAEDPNYPCPPLDADPVLEHDFFGDELEQEEEEEGRMDEMGSVGQAVPETSTGPMLVDEPQIFDNHGTSQHYTGPLAQPNVGLHHQTTCTAFHMTPYPKPPASITSTLTTSTTTSSGIHCLAMTSETSRTNVTKGKNMLAQIKADFNEWFSELNESSKEQRYNTSSLKRLLIWRWRMKGISKEAEKIHNRQMEQGPLEIKRLMEEGTILQLKLQLAQLQSGQTGDTSALSASAATGLPPSVPPSVD